MWYVAHGYFAYVNETSFAYPEHLVHEGVAASSMCHLKGMEVVQIKTETGKNIPTLRGYK